MDFLFSVSCSPTTSFPLISFGRMDTSRAERVDLRERKAGKPERSIGSKPRKDLLCREHKSINGRHFRLAIMTSKTFESTAR